MVNIMFLNGKFILKIVCLINLFSFHAYSKLETHQLLSTKQIANEKFSFQEASLKDKYSQKIIKENQKLKIQNQKLVRERNFYIKKANLYGEIVKKLQNNVKIYDNRIHISDSQNSQNSHDEGHSSSISTDYSRKTKDKARLGELKEKIYIKTESDKNGYIRYLESKLELANNKIQSLQNKSYQEKPSNADISENISQEQKKSIEETPLIQVKETITKDIQLQKSQQKIKKLKAELKLSDDVISKNKNECSNLISSLLKDEPKDKELIEEKTEISDPKIIPKESNDTDNKILNKELENREKTVQELISQIEKINSDNNLELEIDQREDRILELETDIQKLNDLNCENDELKNKKIEEKKIIITDLRTQIEKLRSEEIETRDREIEEKKSLISELREKIDELTNIDDEAKNREIEAKKSRIIDLEAEVSKLRSGEELVEYKQTIDALETQIAKTLGLDTEVTEGQTKVWIPPSSDDWIHNDQLKPQPVVSEGPLKISLRSLKEAYDEIKISLTGLTKLNLSSLEELDVEDVETFKAVKMNAARIRGVRPPAVQECKRLFEEAMRIYDEFLEQKKQEIPGLVEYTNVQNTLDLIFNEIPYDDFTAMMQEFDLRKKNFIEISKNKINNLPDGATKNSCIKILNFLELERNSYTFSNFLTKCTSVPSAEDRNYNNSLFVLINQHASLGKEFQDLELKTIIGRNNIKHGLEEENPFKVFGKKFKSRPSDYPDLNENLIDLSEKMYMIKYLNTRWKNLQNTLFSEDLHTAIKNCNLKNVDSKLLIDSDIKKIFHSIMQSDFFETSSALTNASYLKDLDEKLNPALSYENIKIWQTSTRPSLREDLIEIYTTYKGIINFAIFKNSKNPKIKEFHED
ncbi:MAG: hypothetical protein ACRYGR_04855 [Janthinobacterium lividum]